jgi:U3 small nucleolar RNA-associated protein 22
MVQRIALHLKMVGGKNITIHSLAMDIRKTALLVVPAQNAFYIRIDFLMDSMDWIPSLMRLLPDRCNLAKHESCSATKISSSDEGHTSYSVQYNYSLTEDAVHRPVVGTEVEVSSNMQVRHGVALITLWCRQRGFYILNQGFHDDVIAILVLYLIYSKRIPLSRNIQPLSVLTSFLTLLSETQWLLPTPTTMSKEGQPKQSPRRTVLIMPESIGQSRTVTISQSELAQRYKDMVQEDLARRKKKSLHEPEVSMNPLPTTLLDFYESTNAITTPVLLNSTLQHNFLFRISPSLMRRAQQYAVRSLSCLHPTASSTPLYTISHTNPFLHLFDSRNDFTVLNPITQSNLPTHMNAETWSSFCTQYDAYLRIPLSDIDSQQNIRSMGTDPNSWLYHWSNDIADVGCEEALVRGLLRTLRKALQDRILDIHAIIMTEEDRDASIESMTPSPAPQNEKYIMLGLAINPDTCYRVVDRCHTAVSDINDTFSDASVAVQEFISLWGHKAELRRFKDGVIVHAVIWDETSTVSNNDLITNETSSIYVQYHNDDTWQGGIVERIVRHILKMHFLKDDVTSIPQFAMRDILSMVDGVASPKVLLESFGKLLPLPSSPILTNPMLSHRSIMKAFESLSEWLQKNSIPTIPVPGSATAMKSLLGIPLSIDRVEPTSPALRYASLYPPMPHPLLSSGSSTLATSKNLSGKKRCSGAIPSDPIDFQICFAPSSRWPNDLKAIGAAKTAMLIEIVDGIEKLKKSGDADSICCHFDERSSMVTPSYAIICFMGYVFRMTIKADREIRILRDLQNPSGDASRLLKSFTKHSIIAAKHHSMVHGVYTSHPSSSATVRLVKRWLSSHLLASDGDCCLPFEVIELTVVYIYTNQARLLAAPATIFSGFMEWLRFVSSHNWMKRPLIVDPQGHLSDADHYSITEQFEGDRGALFNIGPAWYIVAPYDRCIDDRDNEMEYDDGGVAGTKPEAKAAFRVWTPTFTSASPERVVSLRISALAKRTYTFLRQALLTPGNKTVPKWPVAFQESSDAFRSYSALLRIDPDFIVNVDASSNAPLSNCLVQTIPVEMHGGTALYESTFSRSMRCLANGPKDLRKKLYRNLMVANVENQNETNGSLTEWTPVRAMVQLLRAKLGHLALIFYNDLCPEVIGVVWRQPIFFQARPFSAMTSEYAGPVTNEHWQSDTMVSYNVHDVLRTISLCSRFVVSDIKVFDYGSRIAGAPLPPPKVDSVVIGQSKRRRKRKAIVFLDPLNGSNDDNSNANSLESGP